MGESNVRDILRQIDELSEPDRLLLEEQLVARSESQWQREATIARADASQRGIDQAAIDKRVDEVRYGA